MLFSFLNEAANYSARRQEIVSEYRETRSSMLKENCISNSLITRHKAATHAVVKPRRKYMIRNWCLIIAVLLSTVFLDTAYARRPLTEDEALDILISRVEKDKLYDSWTTLSCLSFLVEARTRTHIEIAIREKHGGKCPGDPDTFPIVDRFRIDRLTRQIQWLEIVEDEWLPYKAVLKERLRK